jgi:hypothetical protein
VKLYLFATLIYLSAILREGFDWLFSLNAGKPFARKLCRHTVDLW